jgi:hypothetical protein
MIRSGPSVGFLTDVQVWSGFWMLCLTLGLEFYCLWFAVDLVRRFYLGRYIVTTIVDQQRELLDVAAAANHTPRIQVILLLPMLREQENVAPLLQKVDELDFPADRLLVVPITTERETLLQEQRKREAEAVLEDLHAGQRGSAFLWKHSRAFATYRLQSWANTFDTDPASVQAELGKRVKEPSTQAVINQVLKTHPFRVKIQPFHDPKTEGNKASQMNAALSWLQRVGEIPRPNSTYIGVYDADSRPYSLSLLALSLAANRTMAAAFQQYPIYLQDTIALDPWMRNEAWLQTARSVCVEIPRQLAINAQLELGHRWGKTFTYCIGHGEFLRADWLLKTGFPDQTPIDDLPTGMMLSLGEEKIVPLPMFDLCSVPKSVFDFFRQSANWFEGQSDYVGPYKRAQKFFPPTSTVRLFRGRLEQGLTNLGWAGTGPLRVLMPCLAIALGQWPLAIFLGILSWLEGWSRWSITQQLLDSHLGCESLPRWPFPGSAITRPILKSVGPCLYLLRQLVGHKTRLYKTER